MANLPSALSNAIARTRGSLSACLSDSSDHLSHLNRLLSSKAHLDTTLLTASYTLHLLHSLLPRTTLSLPPNSISSRLLTSLKPLISLINEYRTFLRLTSLVSILSSFLNLLRHPPSDPILRVLSTLQITSIGAFQALENGAFLAERGVLGWSGERKGKAWRWSARMWLLYTGFAITKLGYEFRLRRMSDTLRRQQKESQSVVEEKEGGSALAGSEAEKAIEAGESSGVGAIVKEVEATGAAEPAQKQSQEIELRKRAKEEEVQWWAAWKRNMAVNLAYAPMCVHYSLDDGFLSDSSIAALGCVVAGISMGPAWSAST